MALDFNVSSPAFKGASVTPMASTGAVSSANEPPGVGGALLATPTERNTPDDKVRVTGQFAQFQHGAGCGHCTAGIASKVFEGKPNEVKSMMAAAASQAHSANVSKIRADVERHEGIHHSRASANGRLKVGAPQINDAAIEKMARGEGGGTLGSVAIQPPDKNAKNAKDAREIAEAFKTMAYAANAGAGDASDADKGVAAQGEAGASEMFAKAAEMEGKEGKEGKGADGEDGKNTGSQVAAGEKGSGAGGDTPQKQKSPFSATA